MNQYFIITKISTLAELVEDFTYKGFEFKSYNQDDREGRWNSDSWVVSKTINAVNCNEARKIFIDELYEIISQLGSVSQCSFSIAYTSYMIFRKNDNADNIVYIFYTQKDGDSGLLFDNKEIQQLSKTENIHNKKGLFYLNEAANAVTYYSRLAMLIMAIEAFAGKHKGVTNQKELQKILGNLHKKLYQKSGKGFRHNLFHGDLDFHKDIFTSNGLIEELYNKIISYLHQNYKLEFDEVISPQRTFNVNYSYLRMFRKFKGKPIFDIKRIEEALDDDNNRIHEHDIFEDIKGDPIDY